MVKVMAFGPETEQAKSAMSLLRAGLSGSIGTLRMGIDKGEATSEGPLHI